MAAQSVKDEVSTIFFPVQNSEYQPLSEVDIFLNIIEYIREDKNPPALIQVVKWGQINPGMWGISWMGVQDDYRK